MGETTAQATFQCGQELKYHSCERTPSFSDKKDNELAKKLCYRLDMPDAALCIRSPIFIVRPNSEAVKL